MLNATLISDHRAQMMQQLNSLVVMFKQANGAPGDGGAANLAPGAYFETKRDRKLHAPTVREKKRTERIEKRAARLRGSRVPEEDADADDESTPKDPDIVEDRHKTRLKVHCMLNQSPQSTTYVLHRLVFAICWSRCFRSTTGQKLPPYTLHSQKKKLRRIIRGMVRSSSMHGTTA